MKSIYFILVITLVAFSWSCSDSAPKEEADKASANTNTVAPALSQSFDGQISKKRFAAMLKSTTNPQLVDVRTPEEFKDGNIEGALNMNFYDDDFSSQLKTLDHARPLFIYCKSGGRSGKTYKMLKDMGVEKVYDLKGGYSSWE